MKENSKRIKVPSLRNKKLDDQIEITREQIDEAGTLTNWAKICGVKFKTNDTLQTQRNRLIDKIRDCGSFADEEYVRSAIKMLITKKLIGKKITNQELFIIRENIIKNLLIIKNLQRGFSITKESDRILLNITMAGKVRQMKITCTVINK
jgi:hypothetical protein